MSVSPKPSMADQALHEALGVRLIPAPPKGFDPVPASDDDLRAYGYPARPDIERYPELHERWSKLVSRPMTFIQPQFEIMEHGRGGRQDPGDRRSLVARTKDSWSGSVMYASSQDPVRLVSGMWTVPAVVRPRRNPALTATAHGWASTAPPTTKAARRTYSRRVPNRTAVAIRTRSGSGTTNRPRRFRASKSAPAT